MLTQLYFAYRVTGTPRRGRLVRHMAFLSKTTVEIPEISGSEASLKIKVAEPVTWGLIQSRQDRHPAAPSYEIVEYSGRLFRPALTLCTRRQVALDEWRDQLQIPQGQHTAPGGNDIPDLLRLTKIIEEPRPPSERMIFGSGVFEPWPSHRIEEVALRNIVSNHYAEAEREVARNAGKLLMIDGRLHIETSEPIFVLEHRSRQLLISGIDEYVRDISLTAHGAPFVSYEFFRMDRSYDAKDRIRNSGIIDAIGNARIRGCDYVPQADDTGTMLRILLETGRELVARERRLGERSRFLQLMEGAFFPDHSAPISERVDAVNEIGDRLRNMERGDDRHNQPYEFQLYEFARSLAYAIQRVTEEIASGIITPPRALAQRTMIASPRSRLAQGSVSA